MKFKSFVHYIRCSCGDMIRREDEELDWCRSLYHWHQGEAIGWRGNGRAAVWTLWK